MRHVSDGMLRRLDDEPLAIPDRVTGHLADCGRCRSRRAVISHDRERAARALSGPHLVPDIDVAWSRMEQALQPGSGDAIARGRRAGIVRPWGTRFPRLSLRAGLATGGLAAVVAGTAAAASLTTIFAPTHVAPVPLSRTELGALPALLGLGNNHPLAGFTTPAGTSTVAFGTIRWSSQPPRPASSLTAIRAETGLPITLPGRLPAGVAATPRFIVQPRATATVTFNSAAGDLAGSTVSLQGGPVVVAEYTGRQGHGVPTVGIVTMPHPTAASSGATLKRIESFLLGRPGVPPQLAEEVRLLGNLTTTLPVPVPSGATTRSVQVGGRPAILLSDASGAASGVIWEDAGGIIHVVVGLLDSQDVLNVAGQLG